MKKKLLLAVVIIVSVLFSAFLLTACGEDDQTPTHEHSYAWVDNGNGTHKQHCANSGCDEPDKNTESHVWGTNDQCTKCPAVKPTDGHSHAYQWVDNGDGTHKQHCANADCNAPDINNESHVWGSGNRCTKCPAVKSATTHKHLYQWTDNGDGTHKQHCANSGCDEPDINLGKHVDEKNSGVCETCGFPFTADRPCNHQMKYDQGRPATCTSTGVTESYYCSVCRLYFADEEGNHPIKGSLELPVLPHDLTRVPAKDATCTAEGNREYYVCGICENYFQNSLGTSEIADKADVVIAKTQHSYNDGICSVCKTLQPTAGLQYTNRGDYCEVRIGTATDVENIVIAEEFNGVPVTTVADGAFMSEQTVQTVTIPDSVTSISSYAFQACQNLKEVKMGKNINYIASTSFQYCIGLTSITIPDGVTNIPSSAFTNCTSLASITIGKGVTSIGNNAFKNCNSLKDVYYTGDLASWCGIQKLDQLMTSGRKVYLGEERLTGNITVPDGVTKISKYAFAYCDVTGVTLPQSLTSIESGAFALSSAMQSITYQGTLADWCKISGLSYVMDCNPDHGNTLFIDGEKITGDLVIPGTVTEIADSAFYNCRDITSLTIEDGVTTVGSCAFFDCKKLNTVTVGNDVTSIEYGAFSNCSSLNKVTLGRGVTAIRVEAFSHTHITEVDYLGDIGGWCNINSITNLMQYINWDLLLTIDGEEVAGEIEIPDTVDTIDAYAFYGMYKITHVKIPMSVWSIGDWALGCCNGLTEITYEGSLEEWGYVQKVNLWIYMSGRITVHCNDGDTEEYIP